MGVVQIVFSPTGGTKKVADVITSEWGQPVRTVDLSDAEADFDSVSLEKGDVAVIAVPSFGGRVPAPATERLKKIHGNQAFAVLVCVYGNRAYEDTLVELSDAAQESGFQVAAGIAAIAEHSIMHQYAAGRPDENDQKELREFAAKIWKKIEENKGEMAAPSLPGNCPYKKREAAAWCRRQTKTASAAASAPASALFRRSAKRIPPLRTAANVFPVCAAWPGVLRKPGNLIP